MAVVPVSQIKLGDRVIEQVFTKRGSLLFDKGFTITPRELDILQAFQVPSVAVEGRWEAAETSAAKNEEAENASVPLPTLLVEYENVLNLFRKVMFSLRSGGALPLLELRTRLESLLQHADQYHVLTFTPRSINLRDYLLHNSILVAMTSYQLAKWHGLPAKDWIPAALGGLLHDIGNAKVDETILEKKGKLTHTEQEEMRTHTVHGYQMLKNVAGLNEGVKLSALQHHEREDGSGYPLGVKGDKIHPYAKIISVADIYHAMTSPRFYKKQASPYLVLEQLQTESFGKLDPALVQTFIQKVTEFHNGTLVRLSDGRIGSIVFSDRSHPTRPWVNINNTIVNLTLDRSLYIEHVINSLGS
ncbi:HD-GYP domain-containing protein [Gorillibacterium sp. sgz5001074]|uniref:HD-GYP domain-containing protein n=1 Tax=Gorillibacterium sp. sgz5001074 TaxID=3446695 RepID=UPI003F6643A3